jgi:hypothetical protein
MKLYDCQVRLAGDLNCEVPKQGVTAPEVLVLRSLHGDDAVVDLVASGDRKVKQTDERMRLGEIYGHDKVVKLFGEHAQLPTKIALTGDEDDDDAPVVPARERRRGVAPTQEPSLADLAS